MGTVTQEFCISVTAVGENEYLARTEQVPPGVSLAEELVVLPIEDGLTQSQLEQLLYQALFQGTLKDSWMQAGKLAREQLEELRLCLDIKGKELAHLPWNKIYDGDVEIRHLEAEDWEDWDDDLMDGDGEYEEDSAFVSGLFRQLSASEDKESSSQTTAGDRTLLSTASVNQTTSTEIRSETPKEIKSQTKKLLILPFAFLLLTCTSLWIFRRMEPQISSSTPKMQQSSKSDAKSFGKMAKTPAVKAMSTDEAASYAIHQFRQGDLNGGRLAVEALLDRDDLDRAQIALATVPDEQKSDPAISFLSGRLIWQLIQAGDKNYNLAQVQRYWEAAVKASPKTPLYHNALGFAYYAQGDLNRANQSWFNAVYQIEPSGSTQSVSDRESLTAYAGLALVLMQSAKNQPPEKQQNLLGEALKLRQKVMREDPINFQPEALKANWLWTDRAIEDWRSLLHKTSNQ